ncbi:MAG: winged helix-turn-helix domain-containing protein [Rhizobiaceae bacterium]
MIVIVDERDIVTQGYTSLFGREGFPSAGFKANEFDDWINSADTDDLKSVGACLIGQGETERLSLKSIRRKTGAPLIALVERNSLENTLSLFERGADDVVRKPVHVREILARISAIRSRAQDTDTSMNLGDLRIFFDGRDPEIAGDVFPLPRRERRILEYLASLDGRRATKSQIFGAIYGLFEDEVEENVVESHISKLRKKLRTALGHDPIDSKRFLGYCLVTES